MAPQHLEHVGVDAAELRLNIKHVLGIVFVVISIVTSCVLTVVKVDATARAQAEATTTNNAAHAVILSQVKDLDALLRDQDRKIIELKTTLLVKGLLK